MTTTSPSAAVPGYVAGTWTIDPVHSDVSFTVRHMMVSKVRGKFSSYTGTIVTGEDPGASTVVVDISLASIDTGDEARDAHVRSADFFDIEHHPEMTFRSTAVQVDGDRVELQGDLSLHGTTRPVTLDVEVNGFTRDPFGGTRTGFSASTQISRKDFGIDLSMPMDGGGVVVGDKIQVQLEVEAILTQPTPEALGQ